MQMTAKKKANWEGRRREKAKEGIVIQTRICKRNIWLSLLIPQAIYSLRMTHKHMKYST